MSSKFIPPKLMLAPLTHITDKAFRKICLDFGAEFCFTEFVSTRGFFKEQTDELVTVFNNAAIIDYEDTEPIGVQLRCFAEKDTAFCIEALSSGNYLGRKVTKLPKVIDLNMGCPHINIINLNEGACFLKDLKRAEKVICAARSATSLPLSIKIRTGWDANSINVVDFARMAESCGVDFITVHGRTYTDAYKCNTNSLDNIKKAKKAVKIPVVGNGDLFNAQDVLRMFEYCEIDSVMIARGAMGNPFIFQDALALLNGALIDDLTSERLITVLKKHLVYKNNFNSAVYLKDVIKICKMYLRHLSSSNIVLSMLANIQSYEELMELLDSELIRNSAIQYKFLGKL